MALLQVPIEDLQNKRLSAKLIEDNISRRKLIPILIELYIRDAIDQDIIEFLRKEKNDQDNK